MELVWGNKDFVIAGQPYQGFPILLWNSMESFSHANQLLRDYLLRGDIGSNNSGQVPAERCTTTLASSKRKNMAQGIDNDLHGR